MIPNMKNMMAHCAEWFPFLPLPPLPAIYGLDASGDVVEVGSQVKSVKVGDRVYVNPGTSCGSCHACRCDQPINCDAYTFLGYFGFGPRSSQVFVDYPYAGFAEYMTAPATSPVKLPKSVSYEAAAGLGYLGTAYSALRKAGARAGTSVIVSGATGTLGLGAVTLARPAPSSARCFEDAPTATKAHEVYGRTGPIRWYTAVVTNRDRAFQESLFYGSFGALAASGKGVPLSPPRRRYPCTVLGFAFKPRAGSTENPETSAVLSHRRREAF